MCRAPCAQCPFRATSGYTYDADALEALEEGSVPSCHARVGLDAIFSIPVPTETICDGYIAWQEGHEDYAEPRRA